MSFSDDFNNDFDHGSRPAVDDTIVLVFFFPTQQNTVKYAGQIKEMRNPDKGDDTLVVTDIAGFENLEIPVGQIKSNPVYKWVAEYNLSLR